MSDLKDRLGTLTAGAANLVKNPGDLITGDGNQAVYLRNPNVGGASDGLVLTLDSIQEEGLSWAPGGSGSGITNVTGSDGITVDTPMIGARNVTNDLVTATPVAQVDAVVTGSGELAIGFGGAQLSAFGAGGLALFSTGANAGITVEPTNGGDLQLATGGGGDMFLTTIDGGDISIVGDKLTLTAQGGPMIMSSSGNTTITADPTASLAIAGGGVNISSSTNTISVTAATALSLTGSTTAALSSGAGNVHIQSVGGDVDIDSAVGITADAAGLIQLTAGGSAGIAAADNILINSTGLAGDVTISGPEGFFSLDATNGRVDVFSNGNANVTATDDVNISSGTNGDVNLTTAGTGDLNANISQDEIHTVGRNLTMTAQGSGGVTISAEVGNAVLAAGTTDNTGEVRLSPTAGVPAAGLTFRIWNGAGAGQQTVTSPGGGTVVDVECRAQLSSLLSKLFGWGWLTDPNP